MIDTALPVNPIEKWLVSRRKTLQEWKVMPPYGFGLAVLLAVSFEFVLSYRLFHGYRLDGQVVVSALKTALFVAVIEGGVLLISNSVASLFNKHGRMLPTFITMNVALLPFLLFLPMTLLFWAAGGGAFLRLLILLVLIVKVLSDWKEVFRVNYTLTGIQVYMLGGVLGGVGYVVLILGLIFSGFGVLVQSLFRVGLR